MTQKFDRPLLRKPVLSGTARYRQRFRCAKPFKHVVIRNAFDKKWLNTFRHELVGHPLRRATTKLYSTRSFEILSSKNPVIRVWYHFFMRDMIPWVERETSRRLSRLWAHMSFYEYRRSSYLKVHNDNVGHRAVAFVVNLSEIPADQGGGLWLLQANRKRKPTVVKTIPQHFNSLILFEVSRRSLHQIEPIKSDRKRLTVSGWLVAEDYDRYFLHRLRKMKRSQKRVKHS